jgi:4-amino-4-deoxy-L-arabinose transferase-like glycosyltransferase
LKEPRFKKDIYLWFIFFAFNLANAFLSYSSLGIQIKCMIFIFGIVFPIYLAARFIPISRQSGNDTLEKSQTLFFPKEFFFIFSIVAILLRFYRLQTFHLWPSGDESLQGLFAIDLIRNWNWRFFYTTGQHPPLLIWLLKFFFLSIQSPFFDLWFLPALASTIFVLLSYWTAKLFFSKNVSAIYFYLLAVSFWPLYFSRFCVQGVLVPLFEITAFLLLGYFLKSRSPISKIFFAMGLGLWVGLGTWAYTSWFVVVFFLVFVIALSKIKERSKTLKYFLIFLISLIFTTLPWIIAALKEEFGGYVLGVSVLSGYFNWREQLLTSASYFTCLFWGSIKNPVGYGPVLGGMLNPLLSSCFFMGVIKLAKENKNGLTKAIFSALILFMLPGVLSADHVEMFRVIQLMPILIIVACVGMIWFLEFLPVPKRLAVFLLMITFSFFLDLNHLLKTSDVAVPSLNSTANVQDENYWAYQKFEPLAQKWGPGLVFTDFILLDHDHTLNVTCYHFNVLSNPKFQFDSARWAGVITNVHYVPFLSKRFPESQWYHITPYAVEDGGSAVGIIPVTAQNRDVFSKWAVAHQYFHQLGIKAENSMNNKSEYLAVIQKLPEGLSLMASDPFLEACFGEWVAQYHFGSDFGPNIQAIRRAIEKGYPTANLYYKLGNFYLMNRQRKEARQAYLMAAKSNPNYTNVQEVLSYLDSKN